MNIYSYIMLHYPHSGRKSSFQRTRVNPTQLLPKDCFPKSVSPMLKTFLAVAGHWHGHPLPVFVDKQM